ncbi:borealin-2 [Diretmus argenteus]
MPPRRTRNSVRNGDEPRDPKELLNMEMRRNRRALFIQQFEKEAQRHMKELEGRMEDMLAMVDKVFDAELMKMPHALQNTRIGDLLGGPPYRFPLPGEETQASDVSIAIKNDSPEVHLPLTRKSSKRVKRSDSSSSQAGPGQKSSAKTWRKTDQETDYQQQHRESRTGKTKRTQSRVAKTGDPTKPKLRSVSVGDLDCSVAVSAPHVTITTAQGQVVCVSEETKDDISMDLLDDVAHCQIQKMTRLMDYITNKAKAAK